MQCNPIGTQTAHDQPTARTTRGQSVSLLLSAGRTGNKKCRWPSCDHCGCCSSGTNVAGLSPLSHSSSSSDRGDRSSSEDEHKSTRSQFTVHKRHNRTEQNTTEHSLQQRHDNMLESIIPAAVYIYLPTDDEIKVP
jgi:hypothetical protein